MDTLFFLASKILGFGLRVETWVALGLFVSVAANIVGRRRVSAAASAITLLLFMVLGTLPIGEVLLRHLELEYANEVPPDHIDGIIVLGGAEDHRVTQQWGSPELNE